MRTMIVEPVNEQEYEFLAQLLGRLNVKYKVFNSIDPHENRHAYTADELLDDLYESHEEEWLDREML